MNKPRLAIVEWEDADTSLNDSLEAVRRADPEVVQTYGILFTEGDYHIIMTHSAGDGNSDFIKIPSCLVRKVRFLKEIESE